MEDQLTLGITYVGELFWTEIYSINLKSLSTSQVSTETGTLVKINFNQVKLLKCRICCFWLQKHINMYHLLKSNMQKAREKPQGLEGHHMYIIMFCFFSFYISTVTLLTVAHLSAILSDSWFKTLEIGSIFLLGSTTQYMYTHNISSSWTNVTKVNYSVSLIGFLYLKMHNIDVKFIMSDKILSALVLRTIVVFLSVAFINLLMQPKTEQTQINRMIQDTF